MSIGMASQIKSNRNAAMPLDMGEVIVRIGIPSDMDL
jgi:hypothetical protein